MANYPKLDWTETEGGEKSSTEEYELATRFRLGGPNKGTWSAIMNGASLTSGTGEYGYDFASLEIAKVALEQAMKNDIDLRILKANETLRRYES